MYITGLGRLFRGPTYVLQSENSTHLWDPARSPSRPALRTQVPYPEKNLGMQHRAVTQTAALGVRPVLSGHRRTRTARGQGLRDVTLEVFQ